MKLINAARPKMAFAILLTTVLLLAGTSAAAALPGVPSSPRVPPAAPWLGWIPGIGWTTEVIEAPDLSTLPKKAPGEPNPMPRTVSDGPAPDLPALPNTPDTPALPGDTPAPTATL